MRLTTHVRSVLVATLLGSTALYAQTVDGVGHYEGAISSPAGEMLLQIDLIREASGATTGTLTIPAQKLKGFPLTNVMVKGKDVSFDIATSGGGYFRGELTASGISGEFNTQIGPLALDFERRGDARTYPLPVNTGIAKELQGVWNGTLDVDGGMRVKLNLAARADGTMRGDLVSVDENNLTVPVAIVQNGAHLTLTAPMIGSSYVGTLNEANTVVDGTYTTSRGLALTLLLTRTTGNQKE